MTRKVLIISFILAGLAQTSFGTSREIQEKQAEKLSFWDRWSVEVGYSSGICLRGEDLEKTHGWTVLPPDIIGNAIYWLNSVEGNVSRALNERWATEIGIGYGWTGLNDGFDDWGFHLILPSIGVRYGKWKLRLNYVSGTSQVNSEVWKEGQIIGYKIEKGKGSGIIFTGCYYFNKFTQVRITYGSAQFHGQNVHYPVTLSFSGIGLYIGYVFP